MSSIALGLAFSSPLLFLLKRIPAPPVEPGVYFGYKNAYPQKFLRVCVIAFPVGEEEDENAMRFQ